MIKVLVKDYVNHNKELTDKNTVPCKSIFKKWRENTFGQTKAQRIHCCRPIQEMLKEVLKAEVRKFRSMQRN